MQEFILYGTSACHLCDVAEGMLLAGRAEGLEFDYSKVDVSESDSLFERYGLLIPVLRAPSGVELRWPFSAEVLAEFVAGKNAKR